MKKTFLILFILNYSLATFSQSDTSNYGKRQVWVSGGIQTPDLSELNTVFNAYHYPQFNQTIFSGSVGWIKYKKHFLLQGEFYGYNQSQSNDSLTSKINSIGLGESIGYGYLMAEHFEMYSFLGINYWLTTVKVSRDVPTATSFNFYSSSIGNEMDMNVSTVTANFETHINYLLRADKDPKDKSRVVLGVNGGYHLPVWASEWMMNKTKLKDGPKINPEGFYISLVFGVKF